MFRGRLKLDEMINEEEGELAQATMGSLGYLGRDTRVAGADEGNETVGWVLRRLTREVWGRMVTRKDTWKLEVGGKDETV